MAKLIEIYSMLSTLETLLFTSFIAAVGSEQYMTKRSILML